MAKSISNRKFSVFSLYLGFQALFLGFAYAGAPLKINYQGRLEQSGQPAEGAKNFVFKIYDAFSGGSLVWTSQAQSVAVADGVFSVILETGTPVNLSTAAFSGPRYVELTVDGVPLSPRQEMVSAPYALVARALSSEARIAFSNLEKDPSLVSVINTSTNAVDWTQLKNVPAGLADGTDASGALAVQEGGVEKAAVADALDFEGAQFNVSAAGNTAGISVDAASVTLQGNSFNGPGQLLRLDAGTGKLPALDGSALTGSIAVAAADITGSLAAAQVAAGALGGGVVASSVAVNAVSGEALQNGAVTDVKVSLSTAAIGSGRFGDERVAISTGAFYGGFNGADQLVKLDGSGKLASTIIAGYAGLGSTQTFTGSAAFTSTAAFTALNALVPGVTISSGLVVLTGPVGLSTPTPNSALSVGGAISLPIQTVYLDYQITANDSTVLADAAANPVAVSLPSAKGITGRIYTIKAVAWGNPVTVVPPLGETLSGWPNGDPYVLGAQGDFVTCQSDGGNWQIIGVYSAVLGLGELWY